jgi:single-strand DNA-binding protein
VNVVTLIGNLATDVELKQVSADKQVASFLLAVDRPSKDGGADFVRVSVWDRQGEACAEYLRKGGRVGVDGRLRSRSWEEDGKRRSAVDVVAHRVQFLDGPRGDKEETPFEAATA